MTAESCAPASLREKYTWPLGWARRLETSPRTQQDSMLPSSTAFTLRVNSVTESGRFSGASPSGSGCAVGIALADPVDGDRCGGNDPDPVEHQLEVPVEDPLA